jgi:histone acetyltransferase (RNA polymerase elongator complex component)
MALVIPIFIPHRGCPHQCLFCNQQSITGQDGKARPIEEKIVRTIEEWLARSRRRSEVQVAFYGGSFTCLSMEEQIDMLSSVRPFIETGLITSIRLSTRPDCIDRDICSLLQEFRVKTVELGVQSLDDHVLRKSRRGHTVLQSREAVKMLRGAGMQVGVQLMVGLPSETTVSFLQGIDEVIRLQPDFVRLYPVVVVKKSGLEDLYHRGLYHPLTLNKAIVLTAMGYSRLKGAAIPVVRMGLQPSKSLEESVVDGPFHPSFGELVKSRIWFRRIRKKLNTLLPEEKVTILVSHRDLSAVNGMKRQNIKRLIELGFGDRFGITADKSMERGSIRYDFGQ